MKNYIELLKKCVREGNIRTDRTNTGTISLFGPQLEFDLSKGFPLDTSRKIFLRGLVEEMFWFFSGSTDNNVLAAKGVNIWSDWAVRQQDLDNYDIEQATMLWRKFAREEGSDEKANKKVHDLIGVGVTKEEFDDIMKQYGIPNAPAIGALGPIYGAQWVAWPDPEKDIVHIFSIEERFQMAEDYLAVGAATFTQEQLGDLRKDVKENATVFLDGDDTISAEDRAHRFLTSWSIPDKVTQRTTINQIVKLVEDLKTRPNSRRHVISAWNVAYLPDELMSPHQNVLHGKMALAPCHALFQFYVEERTVNEMMGELNSETQWDLKVFLKENNLFHFKQDRPDPDLGIGPAYWEAMFDFEKKKLITDWFEAKGIKTKKLSCKLYQRSGDAVIGVPFNIAAYALKTMMIAQVVGMAPGNYIHTFGDFHIYKNHLLPNEQGESVFTQLEREERPLPQIKLNPNVKDLFEFKFEDIELIGYEPHPAIKYKIAV